MSAPKVLGVKGKKEILKNCSELEWLVALLTDEFVQLCSLETYCFHAASSDEDLNEFCFLFPCAQLV